MHGPQSTALQNIVRAVFLIKEASTVVQTFRSAFECLRSAFVDLRPRR